MTQDELKRLLDYNPETGKFYWKTNTGGRIKVGNHAGTMRTDLYIQIGINKKLYQAHRLAFLYMTGEIPPLVDHINRKPFDNRWDNLRSATKYENALNVGAWR